MASETAPIVLAVGHCTRWPGPVCLSHRVFSQAVVVATEVATDGTARSSGSRARRTLASQQRADQATGSTGLRRSTISGSTGVNGNCGRSRSRRPKPAARASRENAVAVAR
jgi:hypothetical protein